jgi:hypothetical protein
MKIILIITVIIIFTIEFYTFLIKTKINNNCLKINNTKTDIDISNLVFESEELTKDSIINIDNCYVYITTDENVFIINDNDFTLMKPNKTYNITKPSKIDFLFIKTSVTYYISKK